MDLWLAIGYIVLVPMAIKGWLMMILGENVFSRRRR